MTGACVALGSNLADPRAQVERAIAALRDHPELDVLAVSPLYGSAPVGPSQPDFVNAALSLETALSPLELLDLLQAQETEQHRTRTGERWGPRSLDLDLLLFGDQLIDSDRLTVPHPRLMEREFALRPLCDVCPDCIVPGYGVTVSQQLATFPLDSTSVWLLD